MSECVHADRAAILVVRSKHMQTIVATARHLEIFRTGHLVIISFAQNFNRIIRDCCDSLCWAVFSLLPREGRIATDTAANRDLNK